VTAPKRAEVAPNKRRNSKIYKRRKTPTSRHLNMFTVIIKRLFFELYVLLWASDLPVGWSAEAPSGMGIAFSSVITCGWH
jgi:hypothetical protein